MNNSDTLLKATINRLIARLGEKIIDSAEEFASKAKDAPENLKKEWEILKEEIYEEAERIKNQSERKNADNSNYDNSTTTNSTVRKIDLIRSQVADLNKKITTNK
tara:strand:- start:11395 stop:11709 length:315 start_codon:yes stop_codon:yes gene_type:complete